MKIQSYGLFKIADIKKWLVENREEFHKLNSQDYPPLGNALFETYQHFHNFFKYHKYKKQCDKSLSQLINSGFTGLSKWTKNYERLGSQDLLMFEVNYVSWNEEVNSDKIKIHKGLYTERKPFTSILCFCKVFQYLYWDHGIHEFKLNESEKSKIVAELKAILKSYCIDTTQK